MLKNNIFLNKIEKISGILNGTTNYILTKMKEENLSGGAGPDQKPKMYIIKFKKDVKIPKKIEGKQLSQLPKNDDKKKIWELTLTYDKLRKQLLAPLEEGKLPGVPKKAEVITIVLGESMVKKYKQQYNL